MVPTLSSQRSRAELPELLSRRHAPPPPADEVATPMDEHGFDTVPTGLQDVKVLARRRRSVAAVNLTIYALLLVWLASILQHGGWSAIDLAIFVAFAVAAPWSVLGVCNALIGLWLLHGRRDGLARVAPYAKAGDNAAPLRTRTAMLMTLRNEDPARALARLRVMKASLDATGEGDHFDWFVLSDTTEAAVALQEERAFEDWRAHEGADAARLHYRRRADNIGYKAGNIRDFCERWGRDFELMIPLDADSLMDGETILRFVRMAEAHPRIGILQSLVVGAPSASAFARIFQFGMRHGMRTYTMGASWWAADCGPFWGHNAVVRIAPFAEHCVLPLLEGDRHILSHDQIEAVLMRRAGYEVRVLPVECGSYEDNPPTLLEFTRRDLRWCQGNMQYLKLLRTPGLLPMSRFQLVWAVSMFIGVPAWTAIIGLVALMPLAGEDASNFPAVSAGALYLLFLAFYLAPKLAGFADVALTPGELARYGGVTRFALGAVTEIVFSFLIGAATTLRTSLFLIGLAFGRTIGWNGQARDAHALSWSTAAAGLWPQALFGAVLYAAGLVFAPHVLVWSLPLTLGYVLAIPFARITASPRFGEFLARHRLCAIPEEVAEPAIFGELRRQQTHKSVTSPMHEPSQQFEIA
jgi:membrane glycosyltransferase